MIDLGLSGSLPGIQGLRAQLQNWTIRCEEIVNAECLASKKSFNHSGRDVTPLDSDNFGRWPKALSQSNEIATRADDCRDLRSSSPLENEGIR